MTEPLKHEWEMEGDEIRWWEVQQNWDEADVEIWFDQPHHWKIDPDKYTIGYHPWESTKLRPGWVDKMNQCDEIWTPSPLIAEWYEADGIKVPIYVYEHGVDPIWTPQHRPVEDKIRFLHIGGEALRKGALETMRAFRLAFPNRDDVELTLKMICPGWNVPAIGKANIVNRTISLRDLVAMYHEHHAFVYPSWGEGFGLTPLQALATGMPTIIPARWAPYKKYVDPWLLVHSRQAPSPWPQEHPGDMLEPRLDDVVDRMRYVAENYEKVHRAALLRTPELSCEYDWNTLTRKAFSGLENRLKIS
jgi:glycosyltransferase involved in cell wall biosynthesis